MLDQVMRDLRERYDTEGWTTEDFMEEAASQYGEQLYDPQGQVFGRLYKNDRNIVQKIVDKIVAFADRLGVRGGSARAKQIVRDLHQRALDVMGEQLRADVGPPLYRDLRVTNNIFEAFDAAQRYLDTKSGPARDASTRLARKLELKVLGPMRRAMADRASERLRQRLARGEYTETEREAMARADEAEVLWQAELRAERAVELAAAEADDDSMQDDVRLMLAPGPLPSARQDLTDKMQDRMRGSWLGKVLGRTASGSNLMPWVYQKAMAPENIARGNLTARPVFEAGITYRARVLAMTGSLSRDAGTLFKKHWGKAEADYQRASELLHKYDELEQDIPPAVLAAESPRVQTMVKEFRDVMTKSLGLRANAKREELGLPKMSADPLDSAPFQAEIDTFDQDMKLVKAAVKAATTPLAKATAKAEVARLNTRRFEINSMRTLVHVQEILADSVRAGYVPHYWEDSYKTVLAFDKNTHEVIERRTARSEIEVQELEAELLRSHPTATVRAYASDSMAWLPESMGKRSSSSREKIRGLMQSDPNVAKAIFGDTPEGEKAAREFLAGNMPTNRSDTKGYEKDIRYILARNINQTAKMSAGAEFDALTKAHFDTWQGKNSLAYQAEMEALEAEMKGYEALRSLGVLTQPEYQRLTASNARQQELVNASYRDLPQMLSYWSAWAAAERSGSNGVLNTIVNRLSNIAADVFIGLNPTTAALNLTQLGVTGLPVATALAGVRGGVEIAKAHESVYQFVKSLATGAVKGADEMVTDYAKAVRAKDTALADAIEHAATNATVFDIPRQSEFESALGTPRPGEQDKLITDKPLWYMFDRSETANRLMAYVAGFKMARAKQSDVGFWVRAEAMGFNGAHTPAAYAAWFTRQVNFQMGDINRPMGLRGAAKVVTSLKSYPINIYMLQERMEAAAKDLPAKDAARLRSAWIGMTVGNMLMGGFFGAYLPFAVLRALIEQLLRLRQKPNETPFDLDAYLAKSMGENSWVADMASRGILPTSIGGRMGFYGGLFPDKFTEVGTIAAPFAAIGKTIESVNGIVDIVQSEKPTDQKLYESVLSMPLAAVGGLKTAYTSGASGTPGLTTKAGRTVVPDSELSIWDKVFISAGIRPEHVVDAFQRDRVITMIEQENKAVTAKFATAITDAVMDRRAGVVGADERLKDIVAKLQEYNRKNLDHPERLVLGNVSRTIEQKAIGRIVGGTHPYFVEAAAQKAVKEYREENR
jgi:hypothetical protein